MIRITVMSSKLYGVELSDDPYDQEKEFDQIKDFASQGVPVIIIDELVDLNNLDLRDSYGDSLDSSDVTMVERD